MDISHEKKGLAGNETLNYYDSKCNDENNGYYSPNNDSTVIAIVFIIALAIIILFAIIGIITFKSWSYKKT